MLDIVVQVFTSGGTGTYMFPHHCHIPITVKKI